MTMFVVQKKLMKHSYHMNLPTNTHIITHILIYQIDSKNHQVAASSKVLSNASYNMHQRTVAQIFVRIHFSII